MNLLAETLLAAARAQPDRPWLKSPQGAVVATGGDVERRSAQFAHALVAAGVGVGDRVAVHVPKSAAVIDLHLGVLRAGGVYLPLNTAYTEGEVDALVADSGASLVIRSIEAFVAEHRVDRMPTEFVDVGRSADDPATILYTSGTTGRPKGAVLSHGNLAAAATRLTLYWQITADDTLVHILPLFHTHGLMVATHCMLVAGGSMILFDRFEPTPTIDALGQATMLMGVPTHYTRVLADPSLTAAACHTIRLFTSGSAPMTAATHAEFTATTGHRIIERYGMTETCMLTSNPIDAPRPGTVGVPLPGVDVRLGPNDVIEVRGDNVFAGYFGRPDLLATEFTADGWFITGDIGRWDDAGYLEIVGRAKDLIITGGLNVYPKEIELVIDSIDGVRESAVIGIPDADFGEAVVAVVVVDEASKLTAAEIRSATRQHLAGFKVPKHVIVVDELPRNAMGKVEKATLRARYSHPL